MAYTNSACGWKCKILGIALSQVCASTSFADGVDLYLGGYAGYATGSVDYHTFGEQAGGNFAGFIVGSGTVDIQESLDLGGAVGGGYLGASIALPNLGLDDLTLGIEGFYEGSDASLGDSSAVEAQSLSLNEIERRNAKGVVAVLGFGVVDTLRLSARGGYVNADYEISSQVATLGPVVGVPAQSTEQREIDLSGYEVGGSAEYAATDWLGIRLDYGYRNFENKQIEATSNSFQILDAFLIGATRETHFDPSEHYVRGGVVVHLGNLF